MTINLLQVKHILDEHLGTSVQHKKAGEISFHCPFCNHYKPKLQVNLTTQKWHCWVCDSKGQTITSLLRKSNANTQTCQKIKEIYGDNSSNGKQDYGRELIGLPEDYKPLWVNQNTPDYKNALHYILNVRKLTPIDILRYQIGYCDNGPYAGMVIIPSFNEHGVINYYVGRSYYDNATIKHKNPPVSKDIIGFENQINWNEPVVIVEGAFDAISTKRNAIPLFGKIISPSLKAKLVSYAKDIYLALDADAMKASINHIEYFLNQGLNVYLVTIPGKDPNEIGYPNMVDCLTKAKKIDFFELLSLKMNFGTVSMLAVDFLK